MPSLVSKEKSEELGRLAHQLYMDSKTECEHTARKLKEYAVNMTAEEKQIVKVELVRHLLDDLQKNLRRDFYLITGACILVPMLVIALLTWLLS